MYYIVHNLREINMYYFPKRLKEPKMCYISHTLREIKMYYFFLNRLHETNICNIPHNFRKWRCVIYPSLFTEMKKCYIPHRLRETKMYYIRRSVREIMMYIWTISFNSLFTGSWYMYLLDPSVYRKTMMYYPSQLAGNEDVLYRWQFTGK